jgi:hypothetical protein
VTVAVIDTGLAYENFNRPVGFGPVAMNFAQAPDLAGVTFVNPETSCTTIRTANDDHGHGSHVTRDDRSGYEQQLRRRRHCLQAPSCRSDSRPGGSGDDFDTVEASITPRITARKS